MICDHQLTIVGYVPVGYPCPSWHLAFAWKSLSLSFWQWSFPAWRCVLLLWEGSGMSWSESEADESPSTINRSSITALSSSSPSSDPSWSSHCIANAWRATHIATQYVAILWPFLSLIATWIFLSEWIRPLRNPIACSDQMQIIEIWLLKTSFSGKSHSGHL